jgi:transposase
MPSRFQEMLKNQRQNPETSRAGLKWDNDEDSTMLAMVSDGESHEQIAKTLQRTEGSIRTRLIMYALNKMDKENLSLDQVSEIVNISKDDITQYQEKKQVNRELKQKRVTKVQKRPSTVTNTDIYDLLLTLNRNLDALIRRL